MLISELACIRQDFQFFPSLFRASHWNIRTTTLGWTRVGPWSPTSYLCQRPKACKRWTSTFGASLKYSISSQPSCATRSLSYRKASYTLFPSSCTVLSSCFGTCTFHGNTGDYICFPRDLLIRVSLIPFSHTSSKKKKKKGALLALLKCVTSPLR